LFLSILGCEGIFEAQPLSTSCVSFAKLEYALSKTKLLFCNLFVSKRGF
jgi:hypothetical protein